MNADTQELDSGLVTPLDAQRTTLDTETVASKRDGGNQSASQAMATNATSFPEGRVSRRQANWPLRIALLLSALYAYSAFLPFEFRPEWWQPDVILRVLWRTPFFDRDRPTFGFYFSISNAAVNFSAGLLLGWYAAIGWRRATGSYLLALVLASLQGFLTATAMEVIQVGVVGRVATPTDIVTISAGSIVATILALLLGRLLWDRLWQPLMESLLRSPAGLATVFLIAYLFIHCLFPREVSAVYGEVLRNAAKANVIPLRMPGTHLAVQLRELGFAIDDSPYRAVRFWQDLTPLRYAHELAGFAFLYVALATALAAWRRGRLVVDLLLCPLAVTLLAATVEGLQLLVPHECADINVVLIAAAAGVIGPVVWRIIRLHRTLVVIAVVVAAIGYAATQLLSPGTVTPSAAGFWSFVPSRGLERSSGRIELVLNVFEWFAMMIPIGWAVASGRLAAGKSRPSAIIVGSVLTLVVAALLETLQGFVGRVPSIDSVFLGTVGGAFGTWIAIRQHRAAARDRVPLAV